MNRIFLLLIYEHLRHRPLRALLTVLGVAIGVSAWLAIRAVNGEVYQSFEQSVEMVVGEASITVSGGSEGVNEQILEKIQRHQGVRSASPLLKIMGEMQSGSLAGQSLLIWGVDLLEQGNDWGGVQHSDQPWQDEDWESMFAPRTIIVGKELAHILHVVEGQTIAVTVQGEVHNLVVGKVVDSLGLRSGVRQQVVMDIASAQWLFHMLGQLHAIAIVPDAGVATPALMQELQSLVPDNIQLKQSSRRNRQVQTMLRAFQMNLTMLSGISLLVGIFLVYNTTAFSVVHHWREIGILRSLGMERQSLTSLFLLEAGVLGTAGGFVGCWFGLVLARWLTVMIGDNVGELYGVTALFTTTIPPHLLVEAAGLGIGVSLVGALRPAWEASTVAPVQALAVGQSPIEDSQDSYDTRRVLVAALLGAGLFSQMPAMNGFPIGGYASALCLLLGGAAVGPMLSQWFGRWSQHWLGSDSALLPALAAEQMGRNPRRTSVTMAAIVVGLAIVVGVGIMIQSFRQTVELWIEQTLMADVIVAPAAWLGAPEEPEPNEGLPQHLVSQVLEIPGVEAVDPYMEMSVDTVRHTIALVARDMRLHAKHSRYLFLRGASSDILRKVVAEDGVILSEVLATRLGLRAGDQLSLRTPHGIEQFSIKGVFYDYATDGGKAVMDQQLFFEKWGQRAASVFAVYLKNGQDLSVGRQEIEEKLKAHGPIATISNAELKQEILDIFDRTFRVTYVLEFIALSVAVLGIMNTLFTAILERRRELATLRAIGASGRQIRGLIVWESCYLAGLGAVVGIVVGIALSVVLVKVINTQSFGWTIQYALAWETFGVALLVAFAAALMGAWAPARWASRQTIANDLRYE